MQAVGSFATSANTKRSSGYVNNFETSGGYWGEIANCAGPTTTGRQGTNRRFKLGELLGERRWRSKTRTYKDWRCSQNNGTTSRHPVRQVGCHVWYRAKCQDTFQRRGDSCIICCNIWSLRAELPLL